MSPIKLEPWEAFPDIWPTQAKYFTWLRGALRRVWATYPAKIVWKKSQMFLPPAEYKGKAKTLGQCHYCKCHFPASHLEVDHLVQAGACNSWDTSYEFLAKLLDCSSNWVLTCKPCHKVKSYAERMGIDLLSAKLKKDVIFLTGNLDKSSIVAAAFDTGYNPDLLSNAQGRKKFLEWLSYSAPTKFGELYERASRSSGS
jgi:hypothetical protein